MDRGAWWATVRGVTEPDTTERLPLSFPLYMWNLKINDTNELTCKTQRDSQT